LVFCGFIVGAATLLCGTSDTGAGCYCSGSAGCGGAVVFGDSSNGNAARNPPTDAGYFSFGPDTGGSVSTATQFGVSEPKCAFEGVPTRAFGAQHDETITKFFCGASGNLTIVNGTGNHQSFPFYSQAGGNNQAQAAQAGDFGYFCCVTPVAVVTTGRCAVNLLGTGHASSVQFTVAHGTCSLVDESTKKRQAGVEAGGDAKRSVASVTGASLRIGLSLAYKRHTKHGSSSSSESLDAQRCGPRVKLLVDNQVVFENSDVLFHASGVIDGFVDINLAYGTYVVETSLHAQNCHDQEVLVDAIDVEAQIIEDDVALTPGVSGTSILLN